MINPLLAETTLDAKDVAAYLRQHPAFLNDFPDLAAQLTVARDQGPVASLATYQLQHLREQKAELERRLAELISIAAENERLMERVHGLNVALLRATTTAVVARTVIARLNEDFHSEHLRLVLFGEGPTDKELALPSAEWLLQVPGGRQALPEFAEFLQQDEPVSGRLSTDKLARLFAEQASTVRSVAVMRLDELGMLAIGSTDPDRFQPGMGTVFLKMIATTITAALARARDIA